MMRIPGFGSDCGCVAIASDAAVLTLALAVCVSVEEYEPMPLSFMPLALALLAILEFSSLAGSGLIVDAEEDLEKVLARGPRCVSLSSAEKRVSLKL
jgi:hypothetical protein